MKECEQAVQIMQERLYSSMKNYPGEIECIVGAAMRQKEQKKADVQVPQKYINNAETKQKEHPIAVYSNNRLAPN